MTSAQKGGIKIQDIFLLTKRGSKIPKLCGRHIWYPTDLKKDGKTERPQKSSSKREKRPLSVVVPLENQRRRDDALDFLPPGNRSFMCPFRSLLSVNAL